jgi:Ig-like domain-containing protein
MSTAQPTITVQPQSQTVMAGSSATFSVTATGSMPLSYQWSKDGLILDGAVNSSFTIPAVVLQDDGSKWWVVVSNSAGSVMSNTAILHVTP